MTTLEKQLISKSFYKTLMENNEDEHPIKVLGEQYRIAQQNETDDLASIRFAQGEVYFLNKDFETAIYKWKNVSNELQSWAQLNIADAHYEMHAFSIAEENYKEIETDSDILKIEVLLQLMALYIQQGKLDMATETIKKAVRLNPDDADVTNTARTFFEDNQDYDNAVALAVDEVIRTQSLVWVDSLESYIRQGHTAQMEPGYFSDVLMVVYNSDHVRFESLTAALWKSYRETDYYFTWLKEINDLILDTAPEYGLIWKDLSLLYKETYFSLINGQYVIREFSYLIANHLTNWIKLSTESDALVASAAVLAWNEVFPSDLEDSVVNEAENLVRNAGTYPRLLSDALDLFESIRKWADSKSLSVSKRMEAMVSELLDVDHHHLLVAGTASSKKSVFVNRLLGDELVDHASAATILFKDAKETDIQAISDEEIKNITDLSDLKDFSKQKDTFIRCDMPHSFLNENKLGLLVGKGERFRDMHVADSILFVLDADTSLTGKELDTVIRIGERIPTMPIHFLLSKKDNLIDNEIVEQTTTRITTYFPGAKIFTFYENEETTGLFNELSTLVQSLNLKNQNAQSNSLLYYMKESIAYLLEKRVEMENDIVDHIKWNEEIVAKLNGAFNQLSDMEENQVRVTKHAYSTIKNEMKKDIMKKVPEILRNCSKMVTKDSDFGKIHVELNDEMNKQVTAYLEGTAMPNFRAAIQSWIVESEGAFNENQSYLDEMSESFNQLYGEEKIVLNCDFKVIDDWRRDVDRMTLGSVQLEKNNILMRFTQSQFLLKGAGKLFDALSQKELLHNKYKQYIENKDYKATTITITNNFMQQFELFERSLERDISMFFKEPIAVLNRTLGETKTEIEENNAALTGMQKNPEIYRDPLNLFELKLRQYDWMAVAGRE
ncbi:GTPase domain-containing protein [Paraliobacillus sp. X-1268]|uniref:GTPase domain-containing protein n=1 Tax=Paraliobacillus sp. X-1268 TaxID=2213193 RepID=UPI000E3B6E42|nr:GTPase domain-containing protein [Paraliobacillus sp. X-1268]